MNESRELKNAEQLEELLLLTEEIQEELEQKDQLIVELKTQLNESLILNEKLNKENRWRVRSPPSWEPRTVKTVLSRETVSVP